MYLSERMGVRAGLQHKQHRLGPSLCLCSGKGGCRHLTGNMAARPHMACMHVCLLRTALKPSCLSGRLLARRKLQRRLWLPPTCPAPLHPACPPRLDQAGITVVVAAGNNNGGDACSYSPASSSSAITVGSTDRNDALSSFSNLGSCLFTFGPGSSIVSASYSSDNGETTMSGTSMATPHVSGRCLALGCTTVHYVQAAVPEGGGCAVGKARAAAVPRGTRLRHGLSVASDACWEGV